MKALKRSALYTVLAAGVFFAAWQLDNFAHSSPEPLQFEEEFMLDAWICHGPDKCFQFKSEEPLTREECNAASAKLREAARVVAEEIGPVTDGSIRCVPPGMENAQEA
jgi:hypothetical protein